MMDALIKSGWAKWAASAALVASVLAAGSVSHAADETSGAQVKPILVEKLPNAPGKSLTAVLVNYSPGAKSAKHHHAGSVFVYVLSGAVRSENSATGPAKVYQAGDSFFEP